MKRTVRLRTNEGTHSVSLSSIGAPGWITLCAAGPWPKLLGAHGTQENLQRNPG